jgi:hypothetical protein
MEGIKQAHPFQSKEVYIASAGSEFPFEGSTDLTRFAHEVGEEGRVNLERKSEAFPVLEASGKGGTGMEALRMVESAARDGPRLGAIVVGEAR